MREPREYDGSTPGTVEFANGLYEYLKRWAKEINLDQRFLRGPLFDEQRKIRPGMVEKFEQDWRDLCWYEKINPYDVAMNREKYFPKDLLERLIRDWDAR